MMIEEAIARINIQIHKLMNKGKKKKKECLQLSIKYDCN